MSQIVANDHFFEGPEKKLEIVFKSSMGLLSLERGFWDELVSLASAKILSVIESEECKAYLLSESSLFVWDDRVMLITCGTTELIKAADFLIAKFGKDSMSEIFFERKNEYQPTLQKSSALDDMRNLTAKLEGDCFRFGRLDDHHVYVFNKYFGELESKEESAREEDSKINTLELLMYGLKGDFNDAFYIKIGKQALVTEKLQSIFPGFKMDTFFFEPEGFSFNAIKGRQYATIHVTPQGHENYLSLEVDRVSKLEGERIIKEMVGLLRPISFDTIFFSPKEHQELMILEDTYSPKQICKAMTESGYKVVYKHFYKQDAVRIEPAQI